MEYWRQIWTLPDICSWQMYFDAQCDRLPEGEHPGEMVISRVKLSKSRPGLAGGCTVASLCRSLVFAGGSADAACGIQAAPQGGLISSGVWTVPLAAPSIRLENSREKREHMCLKDDASRTRTCAHEVELISNQSP